MESAREAVAKGSAGQVEIQMATHGVEVDNNSQVVPAPDPTSTVNGKGVLHVTGKRKNLHKNIEWTSACTIETMTSMLSLKLCTGQGHGHL